MSFQAIRQYRVELEKLVDYGGTTKETAIRSAFFNLLNEYSRRRGWMMVAEISIKTHAGKIVTLDGTLKDSLRLDWGYWESKYEADKAAGIIIPDNRTELRGIPAEAWNYKLGNRSAMEWILDQYQEKKPKDPTIAEKFNDYRFADYKDQVIDLLMRVCVVSVQTT